MKTVKDMEKEVKELFREVKSLKNEINELKIIYNSRIEKLEGKVNDATNKGKEKEVEKRKVTTTKDKKSQKCKHCSMKFDQNIELENHLKFKHLEEAQVFECNICDKKFLLKWRLQKHLDVHEVNTKYCHYFNNKKECPYIEFGCMFKHEASPECKFIDNCKNKLCQFKHDIRTINILEPTTKYTETKINSDSVNNIDLNNCGDDVEKVFCSKYCSSNAEVGDGFHINTSDKFKALLGFNVKNVIETYDPEEGIFMRKYPCNVCEFESQDFYDLRDHIKMHHNNIEFQIGCLSETCEFKAVKPEELITHMKSEHEILMKKLIHDNKQKV